MKLSLISCVALIALTQAENLSSLLGQKLYKCKVTDVKSGFEAQNIFDVQRFNKEEMYTIIRSRNNDEEARINAAYSCELKVKDLGDESRFDAVKLLHRRDTENVDPFFADYQSYDTIKAKLQEWAAKYSNIAEFIPSIGKSIEGRDLYGFKISRKACPTQKRKSIWFNGGIHAREWISPATVMWNIDQLLKGYSTDKEVRAIFSKFDVYFTPVSNPDGYEYTRNGDRLWRKNRRNNGDGNFGVDLNRNFDEKWALIGSTNDTSAETYHGVSALSEPETQALAKFGLGLKNGYAGIDFHSYGQLILRSWGFKINATSSNEKYLKELGDGMQKVYFEKGYNYTSDISAGLYPAGGAMDDWMAAKAKLQAFTLELCPTDDDIGFVLPKEQLIPCASATYSAVRFFFKYLSEHYDLPPVVPLP
ncbi:putative carboxypeptidase precursor [Neoconidiobolus thromboides FSU 785]|nr:putative carboxypeptidase precursor [Neoconidiobolus thromboides FSU 785]